MATLLIVILLRDVGGMTISNPQFLSPTGQIFESSRQPKFNQSTVTAISLCAADRWKP
jgi:hypothetical protein